MKQEIKDIEKLTAVDPFQIKFVFKIWNRSETVGKLIKMCDALADEFDGEMQIDRGEKGSLSGVQTNKKNIFELEDKFPVIKDLKKLCQQMVHDYFKANPNFKKPTSYELQGWFNKLRGEAQHQPHSHGDADLVINYYLSCPKGKDQFDRDTPTRICFMAPIHLSNCRTYIGHKATAQIFPVVGEMVASPPMYLHYVPPTHSKEWKRSISINVLGLTYGDNL